MVTIDEAHKVFDCMPSYRPAFDDMKQLKELDCPILAMSATLTDTQIQILKEGYLQSDNCLIFTSGVHRDNVQICMQRYKRCKKLIFDDEYYECEDSEDDQQCNTASNLSLWGDTINKIKPLTVKHSTVLYLDFVRDVEEITEVL